MQRESKKILTGIVIVVILFAGSYCALIAHTGFLFPFSSVVSESMQHNNERSEIGSIDTGDIVIVQEPSKTNIVSYVLGTQTGDSSFGLNGNVIIYNRDNTHNPVIHRAIVWLNYDSATDTWSSVELRNYQGGWYCTNTNEEWSWSNLSGTLVVNVGDKTPTIELDSLQKKSGYLTMGDNPVTNRNFDQSSGIVNHAISMEDIRSVPIAEIPWFGILKLIVSGNTHISHVPNSLPSLLMLIGLLFSILFVVDGFILTRYDSRIKDEISRIRSWNKHRADPPHPTVSTGTSRKGCTPRKGRVVCVGG